MTIAPVAAPPSPYKGLAPFEDSEVDALLFFGRERESEIVAANLIASRLTILYGPSGVGKSSLLRAAVAHGLRRHARRNLAAGGAAELVPVVMSSWANDPIRGLEDAIAAAVLDLYGGALDPLRPEGSLADVLDAWSHVIGGDLYVILDQFEEYFLYHGSSVAPGSFAEAFAEAATRPGLRANFLVGLREDALASLDAFKARVPNVFGNFLRLDRLDRRAGEAAIVRPLEEYSRLSAAGTSVTAEPALIDAVLAEVATGSVDFGIAGRGTAKGSDDGGRIEAPYLQLVMQRLWDAEAAEGSSVLRLSTLEQLGGARHLVEDHLERALGRLTPEQRDEAASMFNQLVTPSGTKIAHGVGDLAEYAGRPEAELHEVVAALRDARVLRPVADGEQSEGARYEIFHDVLADAVLGWRARHEAERALEKERAAARRRQRRALVVVALTLGALVVMTAIAIYAVAQRGEARHQATLARDEQARAEQAAADAASQRTAALRARRVALVQRKRALAEAANAKKARGQAVEQAHAADAARNRAAGSAAEAQVAERTAQAAERAAEAGRADAQQQRAIADRRRRQADAATLEANAARGRADVNAARATRNAARATRNAEEARRQQLRAGRQSLVARREARRADAGARLAEARTLLTSDPERSIRLALAAAGLEPSRRVEGVLREALLSIRLTAVLRAGGPVRTAIFSPDGSHVLLTGKRGAWLVDRGAKLRMRRLAASADLLAGAFSPDGRSVAAGGVDRLLHVWDVATGAVVHTYAHEGSVLSVAYSPDGKRVATGSMDGTARIWDLATGLPLELPHPKTNRPGVQSVSFSPDGGRLLTVGGDRFVRLFDVATGRPDPISPLNEGTRVNSARFSHDGRLIAAAGSATGAGDSVVRIWDAHTGALRGELPHTTDVKDLAFSPDDTLLATTGGSDTVGRVWNVADRTTRATFARHQSGISSVAFAPSGRSVLSAGRDGAAYLFGVDGGFVQTSLLGHRAALTSAAISPDGTTVVTASDDGTARLWTAFVDPSAGTPGARARELSNHVRPVNSVEFSPDGKLVLSGGDDGSARLSDERGRVRTLDHGAAVTAAHFGAKGRLVVTAGADGAARIWRVADGALLATLPHGAPLTTARLSPDGRVAVTAGRDGVAILWSARSGRPLHRLVHAGVVRDARFDADGRLLVTASEDDTAAVWRVADGVRLHVLKGHGNDVVRAIFSPDGRLVATASLDATAMLWNARTGERLRTLVGHDDGVLALAFNPSGTRLVTASVDHDARVWNVATGELVDVLRIHAGPVADVAFSADGRWAATAGPAAVGIWETDTQGSWPLRYLVRGFKRPLNDIAFSPRRWTVAIGSRDGSVSTYACPLCGGLAELRKIGRERLAEIAKLGP